LQNLDREYGVAIIAFEKKSGTDDVLILVNASNATVNYSVPAAVQSTWIDGLSGNNVTLSAQLSLSPYQYVILKKN